MGSATWKTVAAGWEHACAIGTGGTLWCWGRNHVSQLGDGTAVNRVIPTKFDALTTWSSLTAGGLHSFGLLQS